MRLRLVVEDPQVKLLIPLVRAFIHRRQTLEPAPLVPRRLPPPRLDRLAPLIFLGLRGHRHQDPVAAGVEPRGGLALSRGGQSVPARPVQFQLPRFCGPKHRLALAFDNLPEQFLAHVQLRRVFQVLPAAGKAPGLRALPAAQLPHPHAHRRLHVI